MAVIAVPRKLSNEPPPLGFCSHLANELLYLSENCFKTQIRTDGAVPYQIFPRAAPGKKGLHAKSSYE
jgi:hypothetical protein